MANATVLRPGQINGAGDAKALFLKVFAGEVLTAFAGATEFVGRHMVRTISSGKSASFPATWKVNASYHTPGAEIVGQTSNLNERLVEIDDLLIADVFFANIDEAMLHFDVRSEYSKQAGAVLAQTFDKNVARVGLLAARAAATVTGANGGTAITSATSKTAAAAMRQALFDATQALDEKDVPDGDRYAFLKPAQYYMLVNAADAGLSADYNPGGNGSIREGKIYSLAGITLVKTNNLPVTDLTADASVLTKYKGNFSTTSALVMHRAAVGTVKLLDLAVEMEYDIRRQGTLLVAKYAIGHGILRPECAVEIKTA